MNSKEFVEKLKSVADNYKTMYVTGCFGAPLNDYNKKRWMNEYAANAKEPRRSNILKATSDTFGFDCVNLIKAILWGWCGDINAEYGGVTYKSGGVPDIDEGAMFRLCTEQSCDFTNIQEGEAVWMQGHIGVYVGNGLVVECTPAWKNGVQFTACNCSVPGYNRRDWTKHGKLPYVTYTEEKQMYRVRKSWEDASSQMGAYTVLENAIKACRDGYSVYDNDGNVVYPKREDETDNGLQLPTLQKGCISHAVKSLQILLIGYGYSCGKYGADGDFGGGTQSALLKYQQENGLGADGICGPLTWARLLGMA